MFAIVEYDKNATIYNCQCDLIDLILLQTEIETQSGCGGCRHLCAILDRCEVHKGNHIEGSA